MEPVITHAEELIAQLKISDIQYTKNDSLWVGIGNKESNVVLCICKVGKDYILCIESVRKEQKLGIDISVFHRLFDYLGIKYEKHFELKRYINIYDGYTITNIKNYKEFVAAILTKEAREILEQC